MRTKSSFSDLPGKSSDLPPPGETGRALSELYTLQCCQWAPIQNSQIIGIYKEIPVYWELRAHFQIYLGKSSDLPPPGETGRALSELYTLQCCQWAPIQNSQIIGIYKEIPVYWELRAHFQIYPGNWSCKFTMLSMSTPSQIIGINKAQCETGRALSELYTLQCCQWAPIQNSQIIGIYKEIPVHREMTVS